MRGFGAVAAGGLAISILLGLLVLLGAAAALLDVDASNKLSAPGLCRLAFIIS